MDQLDFIAVAQFMWHEGAFVPRRIVFNSIESTDVQMAVEPSPSSLRFGYSDVLKNWNLPNNPFDNRDGIDHTDIVHLNDMAHYLSHEFYASHLQKEEGDVVRIGCLDMATYHYLEPVMPEGTVHFLGAGVLGNHWYLMGPKQNAGLLAFRAAENLHEDKYGQEYL